MQSRDLENFYNKGFGWICKNCEPKFEDKKNVRSRLMTEGEAESKNPVFSNKAMARWADSEQKILICPNCEITESISE